MIALGHPFDWHLHIFWTLALPLLVVLYHRGTRAPERRPTRFARRRSGQACANSTDARSDAQPQSKLDTHPRALARPFCAIP